MTSRHPRRAFVARIMACLIAVALLIAAAFYAHWHMTTVVSKSIRFGGTTYHVFVSERSGNFYGNVRVGSIWSGSGTSFVLASADGVSEEHVKIESGPRPGTVWFVAGSERCLFDLPSRGMLTVEGGPAG